MNTTSIIISSAILLAGMSFHSCGSDDPNSSVPGAQKLDCYITGNKTLTNHNSNGIDYYADCDVEISSGTLTIEPGTSIMFMSGAGLYVTNNGSIRAIGTSIAQITMAPETALTPWDGIQIRSNNPSNELSFCNITGGGSVNNFYNSNAGGDFAATISIEDGGRVTINNSTISGSTSLGIIADQDAVLSGMANVSINNCQNYPLLLGADNLTNSLGLNTCSFSGNLNNRIAVFGEYITSTVSINAAPIPYQIINGLTISGNGNLILNQGTTIYMTANSYLNTEGNGYFDINGTISQPVIIRGEVSVAGYWQGITLNTNSPLNVFDYLQISDGGSQTNCFASNPSNIQISCISNAQLTLNNCSSTNYNGCQVSVSNVDGTLTNNSPDITNVCAY